MSRSIYYAVVDNRISYVPIESRHVVARPRFAHRLRAPDKPTDSQPSFDGWPRCRCTSPHGQTIASSRAILPPPDGVVKERLPPPGRLSQVTLPSAFLRMYLYWIVLDAGRLTVFLQIGDVSPNRRNFRQGQLSLENDLNAFFPRQFEKMSIPLKPLLFPPFAHQSLFLADGKRGQHATGHRELRKTQYS